MGSVKQSRTDLTHQKEERRPVQELINIPVGFQGKRLTPPLPLQELFTEGDLIISEHV
jgi:hypothetical protein